MNYKQNKKVKTQYNQKLKIFEILEICTDIFLISHIYNYTQAAYAKKIDFQLLSKKTRKSAVKNNQKNKMVSLKH